MLRKSSFLKLMFLVIECFISIAFSHRLGFVVTALVLVIVLIYLKDAVGVCRALFSHSQKLFQLVKCKLWKGKGIPERTSPERCGSCIMYKENRYKNECIVKHEPRPAFTMAALLQIVFAFFQMVRKFSPPCIIFMSRKFIQNYYL